MKRLQFRLTDGGRALALVFACAIVMAPVATARAAGIFPWTTVGSAGTVDEADTGIVSLSLSNASNTAAVTPATLDIRYNVVGVDGLDGSGLIQMTARYRDNGNNARVVLRLKQVNMTTGTITTLLTLDSDTFAQSASAQTRTVHNCGGPALTLNFNTSAYFVEASLTKSGATGTPLLTAISIGQTLC